METTYDLAPAEHVAIKNLAAGMYDLYAYRWAPNPLTMGVSVFNGTSTVVGNITSTPVWPGGQVEGVTFARMRVVVVHTGDNLTISIGNGGDFDILAGIQLVPVPAPGAPLVMLGAGLFAARRRR